MNKEYILLYSERKVEDTICLKDMFSNTKKVPLGWSKKDITQIKKVIDEFINQNIKQIIFWGIEIGWDVVISDIKAKYGEKIRIKIICNTQDSLLYYDYERNNFFKILELCKNGSVSNIGFLRKGMYETYKSLGYNCSYIRENMNLNHSNSIEDEINKINNKISIGFYPLKDSWDNNIYNQLSVGKFFDDSVINYNPINERMKEFFDIMKIDSNIDKIDEIDKEKISNIIKKNDVVISCNFTDYVHPIYWIAMETGIPCIIGNTGELLNESLKGYLLVNSEDNPIKISEKIKSAIRNKKQIQKIYKEWKSEYNIVSQKSIEEFINK